MHFFVIVNMPCRLLLCYDAECCGPGGSDLTVSWWVIIHWGGNRSRYEARQLLTYFINQPTGLARPYLDYIDIRRDQILLIVFGFLLSQIVWEVFPARYWTLIICDVSIFTKYSREKNRTRDGKRDSPAWPGLVLTWWGQWMVLFWWQD